MLERMRKHFDEQEALRERVLEASRDVVRASARAIAAIHRKDRKAAVEMLKRAKDRVRVLEEAIRADPKLAESGIVSSAQQEYAEAALAQALIWDGKMLEPEELGIPYKPYLAALADVVGELRRHALDSIRADDVGSAERMLELMEEIFELLMEFDYPEAILPGMKRRQDSARRVIERTRGDLTTALRQRKLEEALRRAERAV